MFSLFILAAAATSAVSAHDLFLRAGEVPAHLFDLARRPSGTDFCNKALRSRQNKAFDSRFKIRFNRLIMAMRARDGLESDQVVLSSCTFIKNGQKVPITAWLDDFDHDMYLLELKYGLE